MRTAIALAFLGVALGAFAVFGFMSRPTGAGDVVAIESSLRDQPAATTTSTTTETPEAESAPDAAPVALWSPNESSLLTDKPVTSGPDPVALQIPKLSIDAPVGGYGVDNRGRMDVPDNITEVGWYKYGPSPGDAGSAVLAAHVDLAGPGRGLFYDLDELEPGDQVTVSYSDGSTTEFVVTARQIYLKNELPVESVFSREGEPVLTLVTCGGSFSRSVGSYDSNVVVYAVPVGDPAAPDAS
jgi:LPXTG-site transpeptidase (sortase) family protein